MAHKGDTADEMAYDPNQLAGLARKMDKLSREGRRLSFEGTGAGQNAGSVFVSRDSHPRFTSDVSKGENRNMTTRTTGQSMCMGRFLLLIAFSCALVSSAWTDTPKVTAPVIKGDPTRHDGRLRWAVGVQSYQIVRANPTHPDWADGTNHYFNHQPYLAYWDGYFWLSYLGTPRGVASENASEFLSTTKIAWSEDGKQWTRGGVLFDTGRIAGKNLGYEQRMGWYAASNGRLLASAHLGPRSYAYGDDYPGARLVREVYGPGAYGPVYAVRYRGPANADNSAPGFRESPDEGFKQACRELLGNKLYTQQWADEEPTDSDLITVQRRGEFDARAFAFHTAANGHIVGFWKNAYSTIAPQWEAGRIPFPEIEPTFTYRGAKVFSGRLADGGYCCVYNPNPGGERYPLVVTVGADGIEFPGELLVVAGDIPPLRYAQDEYLGDGKACGAQYVRGITEGNGDPPGDDFWVVYSMNKEDVWVSRIPVPIRGAVAGSVNDDFEQMTPAGVVEDWNVYSPRWAPVEVVADGENNLLRFKDRDPYDYAKAVRVFPSSSKVSISLRLRAGQQDSGRLDIEVVGPQGQRPVRLSLDAPQGAIRAKHGDGRIATGRCEPNRWCRLELDVDAEDGVYDLGIDGRTVLRGGCFAEAVTRVERLELRTGPYRMDDMSRIQVYPDIIKGDLPSADEPVEEIVFDVDDIAIHE